jgi:exodeoxyribonuclease V gamma subunit
MSLRVVASSNAEGLIDDFLAAYWAAEGDVFSPVGIIVPNAATRDWLTEQIASRSATHGRANIASNIQFIWPSEITGQRLVAIGDRDTEESGLALAARIYRIAKSNPDLVPGFANSKRPFRVAQRVAKLFDRYATHRPDILATWTAQKSSQLPASQEWQWKLWRELGLAPTLGKPITKEDVSHLATPLFAFGLGEVSPALVQALEFHSAHIPVVAYVVAPTPRVLSGVKFPLVTQWGATARASMKLLRGGANSFEVLPTKVGTSLLGDLQNHILEDIEIGVTPTVDMDELGEPIADLSIQVHRCHGATRQVEVMRDAIIRAMAADPTLRPRDIVIACPDLDRFASLIEPVLAAVFAERPFQKSADGQPEKLSLPVVIADRSQKTRNALGLAFSDILAVASGRITSADVLSLISHPMIQARFDLNSESVDLITKWVSDLGVRWGIDAQHRSAKWPAGKAIAAGTWREALDRLLSGILMQSDELIEGMPGVVVWDDISGTNIEVIGNLAKLLAQLENLAVTLKTEHSLEQWHRLLIQVLEDFIRADRDQSAQVEDAVLELNTLIDLAQQAGDVTLNARDIIDFVDGQIGHVRSRSTYWWHAIRVGSLVNFKSIPAKVVCILGFDAESLANSAHDGDDLLTQSARTGDPDPRESQRLHLLNAIGAAQQQLIITCDGWDVKSNAKVPPSIAMEEFIESIEAVRAGAGAGVIVDHPRQIADARNFGDSKRTTKRFGGPFSFFNPALQAYLEIETHRGSPASKIFHEQIYPHPPSERSLTVDDLAIALNKPYEVFVDRRFEIRLPSAIEVPEENLDLILSSLAEHSLGDEYLRALEAGNATKEWIELRKLTGTLPAGKLGDALFGQIEALAGAIHQNAVALREGATPVVMPFNNNFPEMQAQVTGNATVYGDKVIVTSFGSYKASRQSKLWFTLASLTLEYPETDWEAALICINEKRDGVKVFRFKIAGADEIARKAHATKILEFGITFRRMALVSVLPAGMDQLWPLASGEAESTIAKAVERLKYEGSYVRLRGEVVIDDMRAEAPIKGFDDTLADDLLAKDRVDADGDGYRMRRYAKWMYNVWSTTVEVIKVAAPKKQAAKKAAAKKAQK